MRGSAAPSASPSTDLRTTSAHRTCGKGSARLDSDRPPGWNYQLVYKFPFLEGDIEQSDKVIELEDQLIEATADLSLAAVEGHDWGSGEMNIFLCTNAPQAACDQSEPTVNASRAARAWGFYLNPAIAGSTNWSISWGSWMEIESSSITSSSWRAS